MQVTETALPGVLVLEPRVFHDDRGYFTETFNARTFASATGLECEFVQDNTSFSVFQNTIRGLHYQNLPHAQAKLVRVINGAIRDVIVDVRTGSPNYGQHTFIDLQAGDGRQVFVPDGFLHGFRTLEDNTLVSYKVTDFYDQKSDGSVHYADPDLNCDWGLEENDKVYLSEKDGKAPLLSQASLSFHI